MTAGSWVKMPTILSAANWVKRETTTPKIRQLSRAYQRVLRARTILPAPIFCAPSAETVASMEDGTRKTKLMNFSTMPTAAASVSPRIFAMMVMTRKAIWMNPSCREMGTPMRKSCPMTFCRGRKSDQAIAMAFFCAI